MGEPKHNLWRNDPSPNTSPPSAILIRQKEHGVQEGVTHWQVCIRLVRHMLTEHTVICLSPFTPMLEGLKSLVSQELLRFLWRHVTYHTGIKLMPKQVIQLSRSGTSHLRTYSPSLGPRTIWGWLTHSMLSGSNSAISPFQMLASILASTEGTQNKWRDRSGWQVWHGTSRHMWPHCWQFGPGLAPLHHRLWQPQVCHCTLLWTSHRLKDVLMKHLTEEPDVRSSTKYNRQTTQPRQEALH